MGWAPLTSLITLPKEDALPSQACAHPGPVLPTLPGGPGRQAGEVGKGVAKAILPAKRE